MTKESPGWQPLAAQYTAPRFLVLPTGAFVAITPLTPQKRQALPQISTSLDPPMEEHLPLNRTSAILPKHIKDENLYNRL